MSFLATLDPDDLTPKQMRKLLNGFARSTLMRHKRGKDSDESEEEEDKENEDLVNLHREKGDSKPPRVEKDDLPKGVDIPEDEDKDEDDKKPKKKG